MKTRIAVAAALLLTLGSALAGTFMYGSAGGSNLPSPEAVQQLAIWQAAATHGDYIAPKVPI